MRIEKSQFNYQAQHVDDSSYSIVTIGTFRIHSIQEWGDALLIQLDELEYPFRNDTIKIYVNQERFKNSFTEGDIVMQYWQIPAEGIRRTEFQGRPVDNTSHFLINIATSHKSDLFYPWDPQD